MSYTTLKMSRRAIPPGIRPPFGQLPTIPATIPGCEPCPVGYLGCRPYCAVDPQYGAVPGTPGIPATTPPPVDPASLCAGAGGVWNLDTGQCDLSQPPVACPSGTTYAPGQKACVPFPPGVVEPAPVPGPNGAVAPAPAAVSTGWWAERTDMEKGLIIAGGGVIAFGLVYAVAT